MKIKSIDAFTLEECRQFIAENPNSSDISIVVNRMNYLLTNQISDSTDIEYEEFLLKYRRFEVLQNYHDAFLLILSTIRSSTTKRKKDICALGVNILKTNIRKIWKWSSFWGYGELKLDYDYGCSSDWLLDRAIDTHFTKVKIVSQRVFLGSYPGLSWHCYYLTNKGANYYLRYTHSVFAKKQDIDKMLSAIGMQLIEEAIRCSNYSKK